MGSDLIFVAELLLVLLLVVGAIVGAIYVFSQNRSGGESVDRSEGLSGSSEQRAQIDPHEFYKRTSLENDEDMRMHLYSVAEYEKEFGGSLRSRGSGRFIGALKAYRPVGDEWYELPPERAAHVLDMEDDAYEVDDEHGVLLLHKLPHGLPTEARDVL